MAKAPIAGTVKTRLIPLLGPRAAAELYRNFLVDTLATARRVAGAATCVICPDEEHRQMLIDLVPTDVVVLAQPHPGLMAGLAWSLSALFERGASRVLLIDADSPTLTADLLAEAFGSLDEVDVCLGPCLDGGYYLVGTRHDCPGLFEGVAASTAATFEQTLIQAKTLGLTTRSLARWLDVDTPADFQEFLDHLTRQSTGAPATRAWLEHAGWLARSHE